MTALERFLIYVKIHTASSENLERTPTEEREYDLSRVLEKEMKEIGLERVFVDEHAYVYGFLPATPGCEERPCVGFIAHLDTIPDFSGENVKPQLIENYDGGDVKLGESGRVLTKDVNPNLPKLKGHTLVTTDGTTVLGADDKSGVCGIIEAVRVILEKGLPHRSAELLFSIGEEGGMRGAKAFDASLLKSKCGYIFDSSGAPGKIIVQAPGQMKIDANVIGKRAHAGLAPEQGISAIQVAAKGVAAMNLLRIDEETTCNIGTFTADFATNIVPDKVHIFGEIRSRNYDKLVAQAEHMRDCLQKACDEAGAKLECDLITNYVSYKIEEDSELVGYLKRAIEKIGCTPLVTAGGGGSDANIWNQKGIPSVVLGTGMTKVHTTEETLKVRDLEDTARLALALLTLE